MRARKNTSYPHPVVGNGDDAVGSFTPSLEYEYSDRETLNLTLSDLVTGNETLDEHIAGERAAFALRVECGATGFRRTYETRASTLVVPIPVRQLYRSVEVEAGVVATTVIPDYRPTEPHADYRETTFPLEPGEVLAVGPDWKITIDMEWDPLRAPLRSLMRIDRDDTREEGPLTVLLDKDRIIVRATKNDYVHYNKRKTADGDVIHGSMVLPALIYAIEHIDDQNDDLLWRLRLRTLMEAKGIDSTDSFRAAQELLDFPVARALARVDELAKEGGDD